MTGFGYKIAKESQDRTIFLPQVAGNMELLFLRRTGLKEIGLRHNKLEMPPDIQVEMPGDRLPNFTCPETPAARCLVLSLRHLFTELSAAPPETSPNSFPLSVRWFLKLEVWEF